MCILTLPGSEGLSGINLYLGKDGCWHFMPSEMEPMVFRDREAALRFAEGKDTDTVSLDDFHLLRMERQLT